MHEDRSRTSPGGGGRDPLPDLLAVAERLALLHGRARIVCVAPANLATHHAVDRRIGLVSVSIGRRAAVSPGVFPYDEMWTIDLDSRRQGYLPGGAIADSVLVCAETLESLTDPRPLLHVLAEWLDSSGVGIVTYRPPSGSREGSDVVTPQRTLADVGAMLRGEGLDPTFLGWTATTTARQKTTAMAIVDRVVGPQPSPAPRGFRVTAIMPAFNEADVIGPAIEALVADGVDVHVIDNWSTDATPEIARSFLGHGVVGVERFPVVASETYDWAALLGRVEEVARGLESDWVILHDSDERRRPPWPGIRLRDGLWTVERAGFNAVDHTVLNFRPIDDGFVPGTSFEQYFRHFEFGSTPDLMLEIKAWKRNPLSPPDLRSSGGHDATFAGRRVFPYKFLLKHYPIRSQSHGERKVFGERSSRWNPEERAKGWHLHYDHVAPDHSFLVDVATLHSFESPHAYETYLAEIIAGAGLVAPRTPHWATSSKIGRRVHELALTVVVRSGASAHLARQVRRLPPPVRDRLIALKRKVLG